MPFIRTHSHWHIALCLLDQCKYDQLKETFEQELWRPEDRLVRFRPVLSNRKPSFLTHRFFSPLLSPQCFEVQLGAAGILWKTELHALMFEHPEDSELEPSSWKAFREESADIRAWALEKMAELTHFVENAKNVSAPDGSNVSVLLLRIHRGVMSFVWCFSSSAIHCTNFSHYESCAPRKAGRQLRRSASILFA